MIHYVILDRIASGASDCIGLHQVASGCIRLHQTALRYDVRYTDLIVFVVYIFVYILWKEIWRWIGI